MQTPHSHISLIAQAAGLAPLAPNPWAYIAGVALFAVAHYFAIKHREKPKP